MLRNVIGEQGTAYSNVIRNEEYVTGEQGTRLTKFLQQSQNKNFLIITIEQGTPKINELKYSKKSTVFIFKLHY